MFLLALDAGTDQNWRGACTFYKTVSAMFIPVPISQLSPCYESRSEWSQRPHHLLAAGRIHIQRTLIPNFALQPFNNNVITAKKSYSCLVALGVEPQHHKHYLNQQLLSCQHPPNSATFVCFTHLACLIEICFKIGMTVIPTNQFFRQSKVVHCFQHPFKLQEHNERDQFTFGRDYFE